MRTRSEPASRWTVLTIAFGTFMCSFDLNAVNMALPLIQAHFRASTAMVEWVVVAYLLALSASLLGFGRLADMMGHKKVYLAGAFAFVASSLLCALSVTMEWLIACVVVQGLAAAMMMSSSNAIIVSAVPASGRGRALAFNAVAVALASCAGPALGGLIASSSLGWQGVYLVNLPLGLAVAALTAGLVREGERNPFARFDSKGCLLVAGILVAAILPLDLMSNGAAGSLALGLIFAAAVLAVLFLAATLVFVERRSAQPILDLGLFKNRIFVAGNAAATAFYVSEFALVFTAPFFLQKFEGLTPTAAGLAMLPMSLALMATAPIAGALSDRIDGRVLGCAGMIIVALSELAFGLRVVQGDALARLAAFAGLGIGTGLFTAPNNSAVMGSAPADRRGVAGATLATMRNVGMVLGEAIAAMLLGAIMGARGSKLGDAAGAAGWAASFEAAMQVVCCVAAAFALLAATLAALRSPVANGMAAGSMAAGSEPSAR